MPYAEKCTAFFVGGVGEGAAVGNWIGRFIAFGARPAWRDPPSESGSPIASSLQKEKVIHPHAITYRARGTKYSLNGESSNVSSERSIRLCLASGKSDRVK